MCVIVAKPKGVKLDKGIWEECFKSNKDGAGFSYVKDNRLVAEKGFWSFEKMWEKLQPLEELELVAHFRIATHGGISKDNCHPFVIDCEDMNEHFSQYSFSIAHNGVLPWGSTKTKSDTRCFVEQMLQPILKRDPFYFDFQQNEILVESFIGARNKLVITRYNSEEKETTTYIINEEAGTKEHGCWFSNNSFRKVVYVPSTNLRGHGDYEGVGEGMDFDQMTDEQWQLWLKSRNQQSMRDNMDKYGYVETEGGMWMPRMEYEKLKAAKAKAAQEAAAANEGGKSDGKIVVLPHQGNAFGKPQSIMDKIEGTIDESTKKLMELSFLDKAQKRCLRRMAADWMRLNLDEDARRHFTPVETIKYFLSDIREHSRYPDIGAMADDEICLLVVELKMKRNVDVMQDQLAKIEEEDKAIQMEME